MRQPEPSATATRILDAAEGLFAELGMEATSMRLITQQAAVNLAAVNYHFRSKGALFEAVFVRRFGFWATECLRELDALEERVAAGTESLTPEAVVMTYVRPGLAMSKDPSRGGARFVRLFSRVLVENHRELREAVSRQYGDLVTRYKQALRRALPGVSDEEVEWRMHLGFSVMFHAFAGNDILKVFGRSAVSARDPDLIVRHIVPFVVAGLTSPPARKPAESGRARRPRPGA
jgi:AcrR family transcriptional regulator